MVSNRLTWCLVVDSPRHSSMVVRVDQLRSDDYVESSHLTLEECEAAEKEWLLFYGDYCYSHNPNGSN